MTQHTRIPAYVLAGIFVMLFVLSADAAPVRIGVMPFEVFSLEDSGSLDSETAEKIAEQLENNNMITVAGAKEVLRKENKNAYIALDAERMNEVSRFLDVDYLVLGSITVIKSQISIDIQLYSDVLSNVFYKTYAEGSDIEAIIDEITGKAEAEILAHAEMIAPSQKGAQTGAEKRAVSQDDDENGFYAEVARMLEEDTPAERRAQPRQRQMESRQSVMETPLYDETDNDRPDIQQPEPELKPQPKIKSASATDTAPAPAKMHSQQQEKTAQQFFSDKPVNIHADTMEYDAKRNTSVFNGNVVGRQGDIVMFADEMNVTYAQKGGIDRIRATGNVKIIQGDRIATGGQIVFYNDQQKIVATKNPRVWEGDNVIHGNKITIFLKEERSVVEGTDANRVSVTLYPEKNKKEN